jgi:hypothetical protein
MAFWKAVARVVFPELEVPFKKMADARFMQVSFANVSQQPLPSIPMSRRLRMKS